MVNMATAEQQTRAATTRRRQYTSQQATPNDQDRQSAPGLMTSQPMPTANNALPMAGWNGPGAVTNGEGITDAQINSASNTPMPCRRVRVTNAANSSIGTRATW